MELSLKAAVQAIGAKCNKSEDIIIRTVSTDSRTISGDCLFVAIEGENFDGHDYVNVAVKNGVSAVMVHKDVECDVPVIKVKNTKSALISLAGYRKSLMNCKVVGVTGSVGKTTTKDFIALALNSFKTHKSKGNENNEIGLPRTVFSAEEDTEIMVLEMGMCGKGEIEELSVAVKPNIGVITNIGVSHIEYLGSTENIYKAKLEIENGMDENGVLILCGDDDLLRKTKSDKRIVFYGLDVETCEITAKNITKSKMSTKFTVCIGKNSYEAEIPAIGEHYIRNSLCAVAVARELGVSVEKAIEDIKNYTAGEMRQKILVKNEIIFAEDCYNANPDSVRAALKTMSEYPTNGRKIAVLGDMLEMGEISKKAHEESGEMAKEYGVDMLLCYGEESKHTVKVAEKLQIDAKHFTEKRELADYIVNIARENDIIWIKGSRGMRLEEVIAMIYDKIDG